MKAIKNIIYQTLLNEKNNGYKNGLYHKTQIVFAYNSNHIEGSTITEEQTRTIFENSSFIAKEDQIIKTNDILETRNHFKAFDFILESAYEDINNDYIKHIHSIVKKDCSDIEFIGDFKKKQNFVGNVKTTSPNNVENEMNLLLRSYQVNNINDLINFHFYFEKIHPFEDGNGRVGRLLMFKECLNNSIVPFIIDEEHRLFYYRGLKEFEKTRGYLIDTCLSCQDKYKEILEYFDIDYKTNIFDENKNLSIKKRR